MRFRPTVVEIDLDAIRHNVRALKPEGAELMAVVKANGYGHGDVPVARAALEAGATWLGVRKPRRLGGGSGTSGGSVIQPSIRAARRSPT